MSGERKRVLLVVGGMADPPGEGTALAEAETPALDRMCRLGRAGQAELSAATPWDGFASLLGLGGKVSLGWATAVGAGVEVPAGRLAFRADFVTVGDGAVLDPTASRIDGPEAETLLERAVAAVPDVELRRLAGPQNLALISAAAPGDPDPAAESQLWAAASPWQAVGRGALSELPAAGRLPALFEAYHGALAAHDVNAVRLDLGENPANALWLHGGGPAREALQAPAWASGTAALVGSGADTAGLAELLGWTAAEVGEDDDLLAAAALEAVVASDVVVVRTRSVLAATASGDPVAKRDAISAVDARLVGPLLGALEERDDFVLAVAADSALHAPSHRLHRGDGVPCVVYGTSVTGEVERSFTELACRASGLHLHGGHDLGALLA